MSTCIVKKPTPYICGSSRIFCSTLSKNMLVSFSRSCCGLLWDIAAIIVWNPLPSHVFLMALACSLLATSVPARQRYRIIEIIKPYLHVHGQAITFSLYSILFVRSKLYYIVTKYAVPRRLLIINNLMIWKENKHYTFITSTE